MAWTKPQHSREEVNQAGKLLVTASTNDIKYEKALSIINNWRSSHAYPLNIFQNQLRRMSKSIDSTCLIAQRIKRLSSITSKLERLEDMKLSQMQDLGGCRSILKSVDDVYKVMTLFKKSRIKHKQANFDDYIVSPKSSGYRGIHLNYKYLSDRQKTYNNLKIEIQIRSQSQHAWATAVEVVGTLLRQALKSSKGEADWLRFFALMSTAIAGIEKTPPVPNTPTDEVELVTELRVYAKKLDVLHRLETYGNALKTMDASLGDAQYYLLKLDPVLNQIEVIGFKKNQLDEASNAYLDIEQKLSNEGAEAVLVSVESVQTLKRAYPNYFLDTKVFSSLISKIIT